MPTEINLPCRNLDGTDGVTCKYINKYRLTRNKPELARKGYGADEHQHAERDATILICEPAEVFFFKTQDAGNQIPSKNTPENQAIWFAELIEAQKKCNRFNEVHDISILGIRTKKKRGRIFNFR